MGKPLIIVESPAKTRTIGQFVGKQYELAASLGHVRDLPKSTLGVDTEHDFRPHYVVIQERRTTLKKLQEAVAQADTVYIATDPDRGGGDRLAPGPGPEAPQPAPNRVQRDHPSSRRGRASTPAGDR